MENMETDWKRYKGPFHWFHWSMDKFIPKITAMLAMLQWSKPRILGWNETSEKNVHWSTLRLPHRPQLVVSKSKFWKHVWIYTVWSSAINTISQSSISFTEPPFPLRSQLRRKARNPAISLAPGDSASNGADRCCENKFLPLRDPNSCLIPKLWNIWNEVKQLDTIYMIHLGEKTVGKKMFRPALSCSVKKKTSQNRLSSGVHVASA